MIKRFRTKIVEIEAVKYTGDNSSELFEWTGGKFGQLDPEDQVEEDITAEVFDILHRTWIGVKPGQWIILGSKGEFYPCDPDTFDWKYEEIND